MISNQQVVRLIFTAMTILVCLAQSASPVWAASLPQATNTKEEEVKFQSGVITLAGTLITPLTGGPFPAVVIVPSSTPNERGPYRFFATTVFAQHGVAALIYDKRGYGQSSGNPDTISLYDLADDALAAMRYLQGRAEIDPKRVGMEGDSQAGWVIPIAAAQAKEVAFIVLVSASGVSQVQAEVFGIETRARKAGLSERVVDAARKARRMAHISPEPADFDPVPMLAQLTQPILIFFGTADTQIPAAHSATVFDKTLRKAGNPDYTIIVYPGANHSIDVPIKNAQGVTTMQKVDGYWDTMANWVTAHVRGSAPPAKGLQGPAVDQSAAFNASGIYGKPPWYATATVQLSLLGLFALIFLCSFLGLIIRAIWRKVRQNHKMPPPVGARRAYLLALVTSALNLLVVASVDAFVSLLSSSTEEMHIPPLFNALPVLALLTTLFSLGVCGFAVLAWQNKYWSLAGRVGYSLLAVVALCFVPFLNYWHLLGLRL